MPSRLTIHSHGPCAKIDKAETGLCANRAGDTSARSQRELPSKVCDSYEALLEEPIDGTVSTVMFGDVPVTFHAHYVVAAAEAAIRSAAENNRRVSIDEIMGR